VGFVSSMPGAGGLGSGVKMQMRRCRAFDLICLYTGSAKVRSFPRRADDRLLAINNRLLAEGDEVELLPQVLKLLPTLCALMFAIDACGLADMSEPERTNALHFHKRELELMTKGLKENREGALTPVLVLCLSQSAICQRPSEIAQALDLKRL